MPLRTATQGEISSCATAGCGYACCEFNQGNYIVMPPGEIEAARERGELLTHLQLTPMEHGGWRAICRATETASCDGGYKPWDCRSYPFFPDVDGQGRLHAGMKGAKCPLAVAAIQPHRRWVERFWRRLADRSPAIRKWLATVRLVGYEQLASDAVDDHDRHSGVHKINSSSPT